MEMKCGCWPRQEHTLHFHSCTPARSGVSIYPFYLPLMIVCYWPSSMALRLAMSCEVCRWIQVDILLNRFGRIFACARNGDFGLVHDFGGRFGARGASDARAASGYN